jgi:hypothetical protein
MSALRRSAGAATSALSGLVAKVTSWVARARAVSGVLKGPNRLDGRDDGQPAAPRQVRRNDVPMLLPGASGVVVDHHSFPLMHSFTDATANTKSASIRRAARRTLVRSCLRSIA